MKSRSNLICLQRLLRRDGDRSINEFVASERLACLNNIYRNLSHRETLPAMFMSNCILEKNVYPHRCRHRRRHRRFCRVIVLEQRHGDGVRKTTVDFSFIS